MIHKSSVVVKQPAGLPNGFILFFAACALLLGLQACEASSGYSTTFYHITYLAPNADSGTPPAPGVFPAGSTAKVADNTGGMWKSGAADGKDWIFTGWSTSLDGTGQKYSVGKRFPINGDLVLYAQWKEISSGLLAAKRWFWAQDPTDNSWYGVEAVELEAGDDCIIYADLHAFLTIDESWGQDIVNEYEKSDTGIYEKITGVFKNTAPYPSKTIEDVDDNDKVIFLLLDIQDGYSGSGGYVAGYFHSYHMYQRSPSFPYSNGADMLFMDIDPGTPDPENPNRKTFYSTMAHELQHLINWSIRLYKNGDVTKDNRTETWLDEGLSTVVEYIYSEKDTDRVAYFTGDPYQTIVRGNNFFYWNEGGTWDNDVLADYATAYLFFRWLGIHNIGGNDIYTDILNSDERDYKAVTGAAAGIATGINSGASNDAEKWAALLGGWMRANMTGNPATVTTAPEKYFGYKNEVKYTDSKGKIWVPEARYYYGTNHNKILFYPGEGVFSLGPKGSTGGSGNHIEYVGGISGKDEKGNPVSLLLTYNSFPNINGGAEWGFLANITEAGGRSAASGRMSVSGGGEAITLPASYPVGFRDLPGERAQAGRRSAGAGLKK
jgi:hypothetical protein